MTHLAGVADRIDRSYSPRGEGEERELDILFNVSSMIVRPIRRSRTYTHANASPGS